MDEVSLEADLGRTVTSDPQRELEESDRAEGSLSGVSNQETAGSSVQGSVSADEEELYDVDINNSDRDVEEEEEEEEEEVVTRWDAGVEAASASVDEGVDETSRVETDGTGEDGGESDQESKGAVMSEESHRSSAAEIPVTSNGDLDQNPESVFQRDSYSGGSLTLNLPEASVSPGGVASSASPAEGVFESGPFKGSASVPTSPVTPVAPSSAVGGRLARSLSERRADKGPMEAEPNSGALVLSDDMKSPALEKLDLVRKWSINAYKCTRQILSEKMGRGSRTVDLELEAQIEVLRDNKRKYQNVIRLAQTLALQLSQIIKTQRQLGDAFADLSLKSPELHEEFGYNAETQKLLSKNGDTLLGAITFFINSVNTLVDKTIEDTLINIKQYELSRVEYDAYRTDLEELNLGPRDSTTLPKIEQSQQLFQVHREKYERMRKDVSVKLKFLEENKVKVLHNQLILFHNAISAYYAGNQQQLEQTLKQFHVKLKIPGADTPSWLEEH